MDEYIDYYETLTASINVPQEFFLVTKFQVESLTPAFNTNFLSHII